MMKKLLLSLSLICIPATVVAATQAVKQGRVRYPLTRYAGMPGSQANQFMAGVVNALYYDTAVELLAASPTDGVLGYAIDTDVFYKRAGSAWVIEGAFTAGLANAGGTTLIVARPGGVHTGGIPATATAEGNDATPVNTEIYYSEIFVPCNMTVTGIAHFNGSNVGTDARHSALLDIDGALVTGSATGADATTGANVYDKQAFTGGAITVLGPATYFVAVIYAASTGRYNAHGTATTALGFPTNMIAGKITGQTYGAIPATNTLTMTYTTDLGPIASLY